MVDSLPSKHSLGKLRSVQPDPLRADTLPALVEAAAAAYGDREAIVDGATRIRFAELAGQVDGFARAVMAAGVEPGDRVAMWAPNGWRWVVAALGAVRAGAVLIPLNTRYKGAEAAYILNRTKARLLVTVDGFLGNDYVGMLSTEDVPHLEKTVLLNEWDEFIAGGARVTAEAAAARAAAIDGGDVSDIFFTSGTTGNPKGAMLTHAQAIALYTTWSDLAGLRTGDRYLLVNPFFHTFGYKAGVLACLLRGATIVPQAVFDVDASLGLIERERITVMPGPPTLYTSILNHPDRGKYDLSSLRVAVTGATTVPVALIERLHAELTLERVLTAYGLTETAGTATMCRPDDTAETVANTCGGPVPGVELAVVDADGKPVPAGEPGEVLIRGYNVMVGYLDDPEATKAAIDDDGWLHTGDIGVLDQRGYLKITDRLKDMYICGGFNVYPAEIEQVLAHHAAVAEAAVVGAPDERLGEVGRAVVVLRHGRTASAADLVAWCRERLANFKVPRTVEFVEALPRNASGKVIKSSL
ncbi:putative fatty-acid-CoA ligase FadD [Virgisporangium aurantiacum]|uniref:Putative fatty-acid-CoA ligase FadD n=1 Tax=Virgisporangium aurantiacum TaxID=175570 RepID=A0A8J4E038_9ACTN|nr:putative fatty-acid-CoA ligase FadD [Virgisporangium aurantiacum]